MARNWKPAPDFLSSPPYHCSPVGNYSQNVENVRHVNVNHFLSTVGSILPPGASYLLSPFSSLGIQSGCIPVAKLLGSPACGSLQLQRTFQRFKAFSWMTYFKCPASPNNTNQKELEELEQQEQQDDNKPEPEQKQKQEQELQLRLCLRIDHNHS
uniref:HDC14516 n=1 Tax=Drosophila melanogaster TaxID=7227 RepID=Q6IJP1_DROME|nr:TPA_inf: HDC14516 [Drosophila melanogaster]